MLKIRLQRVGRKHEPVFRVVLTDSQNGPKSGKFLEILGSYDARDKNTTKFDADRISYWLSKGAQPSDTIHNLLIDQKIIEAKKINVLPKKSPIVNEEETKEEAPKAEEAAATSEEATEEVKEESAPAEEAPATEEKAEETPAPAEEAPAPAEEVKEETPADEPAKEEAPVEEKPKEE